MRLGKLERGKEQFYLPLPWESKSGPAALWDFKLCNNCATPSKLIWIVGISGRGSPSKVGILDTSSLVKTDEKYSAKTFALDKGLV